MTADVSLQSLLERVRVIEPVLRRHSAQAENQRRLSSEATDAMRKQGLFRLWKPRSLGGLELDPSTAFALFEEVSRIDSAAGWNLQLSCGADPFLAWFPDQGARETFADPGAILGGAFFPPRQAITVKGGYRVSGRTPFTSGAHHCTQFLGLAQVYDGDRPRLGADGNPVSIITSCPASDVGILDTWHTMGMRGTGSHDTVMEDVFVPEHRVALLVPRTRSAADFEGPLYRYTAWVSIAALATPALGIARAALDDLLELGGKKSPAYLVKPLKERAPVQAALGEAEATLGAARAYLHEAAREFWDRACRGEYIDRPAKIKLQLAGTHAALAAAKVVDLVYRVVGTTGIRQEHRFERHFRDVHTIMHHGYIAPGRYESVGQLMFGVPVEWPFYSI